MQNKAYGGGGGGGGDDAAHAYSFQVRQIIKQQ